MRPMPFEMTVVHVSGYSLAEDTSLAAEVRRGEAWEQGKGKYNDWQHVCLGDTPGGFLGRVPTAIRCARLSTAYKIVWSTGCSRVATGGLSEARMMRNLADLAKLQPMFPRVFRSGLFTMCSNAFTLWLDTVSVYDEVSVDTRTSMEFLWKLILEVHEKHSDEQIKVLLVSSQNHVMRVFRDACAVFGTHSWLSVETCGAHTSYGGKTAADTIVLDLGS